MPPQKQDTSGGRVQPLLLRTARATFSGTGPPLIGVLLGRCHEQFYCRRSMQQKGPDRELLGNDSPANAGAVPTS